MTTEPRFDNQSPGLFGPTPSQTIGPFFHFGLPWKGGADLVGGSDLGARPELFPPVHYVLSQPRDRSAPTGEVIDIVGRILDGERAPIPDAMLEIWQADGSGHYARPADTRTNKISDPSFIGFGRSSVGEDGEYRFRTIRPGPVPGPDNGFQAPHIAISLFARGLLNRLITRLYFEDCDLNADDPILNLLPRERRQTLISREESPGVWRFDILLQGVDETVFFEL